MKRTYLLVEVEIVPDGNKNLLTTFHGIFDDLDAARDALMLVAKTLMKPPTIGGRVARGFIDGKKASIYIQEFATVNKVVI